MILITQINFSLSSDNDDFDVTAQLQDKVASLGLENKLKEPTPEPKKEVKSVKKEPSRVANSNRQGDLTQAEIMELQKRGDMECFMDLLGKIIFVFQFALNSLILMYIALLSLLWYNIFVISGVEKVEKKFADLEDKVDFQEFAQKSSEAFTSRSNHKYYNDFVYSLVDELSKPCKLKLF